MLRRLSRLGRRPPVTPGEGSERHRRGSADTERVEAPGDLRRREPGNRAGVSWRRRGVLRTGWKYGGRSRAATARHRLGHPCSGGPPTPRRSPALRVRPLRAAGRRRAHTMSRFQTWLRSRSRRAGAGAGGTEGRKEPVGPRVLLPSPPRGRGGGPGAGAGGPGEGGHRWARGPREDVEGRSRSDRKSVV